MMRLDATSEGGTQAVGTPLYMAPEQFRGKGRVSPATDIYALGMLAYLLLVGKHYWREEREACENPFAFASLAAKGRRACQRTALAAVLLTPAFDAWFARQRRIVPRNGSRPPCPITTFASVRASGPIAGSVALVAPRRRPFRADTIRAPRIWARARLGHERSDLGALSFTVLSWWKGPPPRP